jgi:hypothetical protein
MPRAGQHYPGTYAAMRAWFPDDAACMDYLDWLRWPAGFRFSDARPVEVQRVLGAKPRRAALYGLSSAGIPYRGHDLPGHSHAAHRVVRRGLASDHAEERHLSAGAEASTWPG